MTPNPRRIDSPPRPARQARRHTLRALAVALLLGLLLPGAACGNDDPSPGLDTPDPGDQDPRLLRATSSGGRFVVECELPEAPAPFQRLFDVELRVFDAESGARLEGVEASVTVELQTFGNRMLTAPRTHEGDDGAIRVEGLLFHVPLPWELTVELNHEGRRDRVAFDTGPVGLYEGELSEVALERFSEDELRRILTLSPAEPMPADPTNAVADDPRARELGQRLFFDLRFSADGTVACSTCHAPSHGFSDPRPLSQGVGETDRRSMPVIGAGHQRWMFWDGRADSLWSQALQPLESEVEHGTNRTRIAHAIYEHAPYREAYEALFGPMPDLGDGERFPRDARPVPGQPEHPEQQAWEAMRDEDRFAIDRVFANVGKALAAYERQIDTPMSPFDTFVAGLASGDPQRMTAISEQAIDGLKIFVGKGNCVFCHSGPQMSNFEFHNLGLARRDWMPEGPDEGRSPAIAAVVDNPFSARGPHSDAPDGERARLLELLAPGGFDAVGAFKTPGLRNVELRAPYMHGGHFATLEDVMIFYGDLQEDGAIGSRDPLVQPINLSPDEVDALVAFMKTLTGDPLPDGLTRAP